MTIITVRSWASAFRDGDDMDEDDEGDVDLATLRRLDGMRFSEERIAEYLQDGDDTIYLHELGVTGGVVTLHFDEASGSLYCEVRYEAPRRLTEEELECLRKYTRDQFSDGVGECWEPPAFDPDLYVSLGSEDESVTISQD